MTLWSPREVLGDMLTAAPETPEQGRHPSDGPYPMMKFGFGPTLEGSKKENGKITTQ